MATNENNSLQNSATEHGVLLAASASNLYKNDSGIGMDPEGDGMSNENDSSQKTDQMNNTVENKHASEILKPTNALDAIKSDYVSDDDDINANIEYNVETSLNNCSRGVMCDTGGEVGNEYERLPDQVVTNVTNNVTNNEHNHVTVDLFDDKIEESENNHTVSIANISDESGVQSEYNITLDMFDDSKSGDNNDTVAINCDDDIGETSFSIEAHDSNTSADNCATIDIFEDSTTVENHVISETFEDRINSGPETDKFGASSSSCSSSHAIDSNSHSQVKHREIKSAIPLENNHELKSSLETGNHHEIQSPFESKLESIDIDSDSQMLTAENSDDLDLTSEQNANNPTNDAKSTDKKPDDKTDSNIDALLNDIAESATNNAIAAAANIASETTEETNDDDDDDTEIRPVRRTRRLSLDSDSTDTDEFDVKETKSDSSDEEKNKNGDDLFCKKCPPHKWRALHELQTRQVGMSNRTPSSMFRERIMGSLRMVQRLTLMHKMEYHQGCVNALNFNRIGTLLASGSDDLNIVLWNWVQNKPALIYDSGHRGNVFQAKSMPFSGDCHIVICARDGQAKFMPFSGDCHIVSCARDGQVRLAELSLTGVCKATKKVAQHKSSVHKLALEYDSPHTFLSCGEDGCVFEIDLREDKHHRLLSVKESGRRIPLYSIHTNPTDSLEFCVSGLDQYIRIIMSMLSVKESGRRIPLYSIHTNPTDSLEFCVSGLDQYIRIIKMMLSVKGSGRRIPLYSIHTNPTDSLEFCVSGLDQYIRVYDKRKIGGEDDTEPLKKYCPHHLLATENKANVTCACYNYNGTEIVGTYNDENIYLFNNHHSTGAEYIKKYEGHRNNSTVKGVNFYGPKSEYVISGSDCGNLYFWDKNTEAIVQYLQADNTGVVNVSEPHPFAPILATSGLDSDVKVWAPIAQEATQLNGIHRITKKNKRNREYRHSNDPHDLLDSQLFLFLLRATRRSQRQRPDGDDSDSSSNDSDDNTNENTDDDDDDVDEDRVRLLGDRTRCVQS